MPTSKRGRALLLGGTIGDGNQQRMLALAARMPNHKQPMLNSYEKVTRYMKTLEPTYTSPQLFSDARQSRSRGC